MAVTDAEPMPGTPARPVRLATFAQLKLRILGNSLQASGRRALMFVLGGVFGAIFGLIGFGVLLVTGLTGHGSTVAAMIGAAIVIGWVILPLLVFGVDETVDPARFGLLPISRPRLLAGQIVTALIGIPAAATAIALLGFVLGSLRHGMFSAVTALVGAALTLLFGIVGSRAITSTFAASLRSRKAKDLASVVIAMLGASVAPLEAVAFGAVSGRHSSVAGHVVAVLGWTPAAAGFVAPYDVVAGRPLIALARLGVLLGAVVLGVLVWLGTLESAMIGTTGGPRRSARSGDPRGAVHRLLPVPLRPLGTGPLIGIAGREMRYWVRDPRRRAALLTMLIVFVVLPLLQRSFSPTTNGSFPTWVLTGFMGIMVGILLANTFSFDSDAYGLHVLANIPPRTEMTARVLGYALTLLPVFVVANVVLAIATKDAHRIPAAIGTLLGTVGVSLGTAVAFSIPAAYPMPETRNMLAMNTGTGSERGLLGLVAVIIATVASVPVFVAAHLYGWEHGWMFLLGGLAWGVAGVTGGILAGAATLRRRQPDRLLVQITARP
jgi:ABC-2 type transport system permease protein